MSAVAAGYGVGYEVFQGARRVSTVVKRSRKPQGHGRPQAHTAAGAAAAAGTARGVAGETSDGSTGGMRRAGHGARGGRREEMAGHGGDESTRAWARAGGRFM